MVAKWQCSCQINMQRVWKWLNWHPRQWWYLSAKHIWDIQGGPKVCIQYIVLQYIITVYLLLAHPVCECSMSMGTGFAKMMSYNLRFIHSNGFVHKICTQLAMTTRDTANCVHEYQDVWQKSTRICTVRMLFSHLQCIKKEGTEFLKSTVTSNKTWAVKTPNFSISQKIQSVSFLETLWHLHSGIQQ
jgi:hypothetical protein